MNNSLFGKMQSVLMSQSDIKDICDTLKRGYYPLAVSGLSSIHKAQLALIISTLSEESAPLLIITDDEAGAKRICDDINEMYAVPRMKMKQPHISIPQRTSLWQGWKAFQRNTNTSACACWRGS